MTMVEPAVIAMDPDVRCSDRIGPARILKFAFDGHDLRPLRAELAADANDPGAAMDLSVVDQILGDAECGLRFQNEALARQRLYRSPRGATPPRLRVLALAAPLDIGGNTPIEFLITAPDVELTTLYVVPGQPLPQSLPEHDIAVVIMSDGDDSAQSIQQVVSLAPHWPKPIVNRPDLISRTNRDRLFKCLDAVPGIDIPETHRFLREEVAGMAAGTMALPNGLAFPLVVRPIGSHAGKGLARLDAAADVEIYLDAHDDREFFLVRFVDYSSFDGLFRKYRIVFVDGRPFACHMAISDQWKIWYLNADMNASALKRAEEARFMERFDEDFGRRHDVALNEIATRVGLDYFAIDCGETKTGKLLVFEADVAMVVHDMDPVDLFPYKSPQMKKIFAAFMAMLDSRANP